MHSIWSDGSVSIAEMADACLRVGQSRICITDHGNWYRQDLDAELAALALQKGCLFAIDSDAHSIAELKDVEFGLAAARLAQVPAERVINCWEDERLLEWLKRPPRI
jgi:histidinol phosphatase-like PHP family hydrolase